MTRKHLNQDARAIIDLSNAIAREYELEYVGTEHILLAILRHGQGVGAAALQQLKVTEPKTAREVQQLNERAKEDTWVFGRLPGSPHYLNVIERAQELSEELESDEIGSEHILLALFQDHDSAAYQILHNLGVNSRICRNAVQQLLGKS